MGASFSQMLNLEGHAKLTKLPTSIGHLKGLQTIVLNRCIRSLLFLRVHSSLASLAPLAQARTPFLLGMARSIMYSCTAAVISMTCVRLSEYPPSFIRLGALKELHMEDCRAYYCFELKKQSAAFTDLPKVFMRLKSLRVLNLSGCDGLNTLPESVGELALLQELLLAGSALQQLPCTLSRFQELRVLNLRGCSGLTALPLSLGSLVGLRELDLGGTHLVHACLVRLCLFLCWHAHVILV